MYLYKRIPPATRLATGGFHERINHYPPENYNTLTFLLCIQLLVCDYCLNYLELFSHKHIVWIVLFGDNNNFMGAEEWQWV